MQLDVEVSTPANYCKSTVYGAFYLNALYNAIKITSTTFAAVSVASTWSMIDFLRDAIFGYIFYFSTDRLNPIGS